MSYGVNLSGPYLNPLKDELVKWAAELRLFLYKQLTEDYPYGSVKLNSVEQWSRFTEMKPQDYEMLISMLNEKYRGMPNAYDLVNKDLASFLGHMMTLGMSLQGGGQNAGP